MYDSGLKSEIPWPSEYSIVPVDQGPVVWLSYFPCVLITTDTKNLLPSMCITSGVVLALSLSL